ncbi:MAG: family transporter [Francisellaceae bacterium]|nr:family transporter [Francisellaceae bacterium]
MIAILRTWFQRHFSDPEAVLLLVLLISGVVIIMTLGGVLAPLLASIVFAYLLEGIISYLVKCKIPRSIAFPVTYLGFLGLLFVLLFVLFPAIWKQLINFVDELPHLIQNADKTIHHLSEKYPKYFSETQVSTLMDNFIQDIRGWGKIVLSFSLSSIPGIITWLVYLVLVPLLVFFFLKDKTMIHAWFLSFLPQKRSLLTKVSSEVNSQIGNYVRGKVTEIIILGLAVFAVFLYMDLKYAVLLSFIIGLSSLVPYIGAVVVTIPVAAIAYLQWGFTTKFAYLMGGYGLIMALDANVLVPLFFSEVVNLHPIAIVISTLVFGGIWGFWGIFFAIPLATLVKAVLYAWPSQNPRLTAYKAP